MINGPTEDIHSRIYWLALACGVYFAPKPARELTTARSA
jgi:hypothetical protein